LADAVADELVAQGMMDMVPHPEADHDQQLGPERD
jgi:hypothetical protein